MTTDATQDGYIAALDEPRRTDVRTLHELIRAAVPRLEPTMQFGMLGYGTYHYRYPSGREGDWVLVALASNKRYISLYVTATSADGRYLAEAYAERMPKASIGRSCIRGEARGRSRPGRRQGAARGGGGEPARRAEVTGLQLTGGGRRGPSRARRARSRAAPR